MTKKIVLLLILLPFICSEGVAQSRIFWADAQNPKIRSVHLDGSNVNTVTSAALMTGMTIDHERGWIYYLDFPLGHGQYGELRRLPMTGGSEEILLDIGWSEGGLAIDYVQDKIYWATRLRDMNYVTIMRANLDGTEAEEIASDVSERCYGIAVDQVGRKVYWTTGDGILRADIASGLVEDVSPPLGAPPYPREFDGGITIAEQTRKMYWTRGGNRSSSGIVGLFRADLDGSEIELLWEDYYADASDIAVDEKGKYVYWTQWSAFINPPGVLIRRARIDEPIMWQNVQDIVTPPDTPDDLTRGLALFLDPGPPILEAPVAEAAGVSTTTELRWHRVECSPRYDVQVASDSAFNSIVYRTNTPHQTDTFVAPVAQHRYWWRVHSNACGIASHWSSPWWFDVGSTGPLAPVLIAPEHDASTGPAVAFSWTSGTEAAYDRFQLATVSDFSSTIVDAESLSVSVFDVDGLAAAQTYYWRVAGFDETGRYTFAAPQAFSVIAGPPSVNLVRPDDGQTEVAAYTVFEWEEAEGVDSYHFELSNATDFAAIVVDTVVSGTTYEMTAPLAYASEHFWRVCGVNAVGEGPWTSRSFTVAVGTATEPPGDIPFLTEIGPAYPNPAGQSVHIPIALATPGRVEISIYDMFGRRVSTILDESLGAGHFSRQVDIVDLASGIYVAVLKSEATMSKTTFIVTR